MYIIVHSVRVLQSTFLPDRTVSAFCNIPFYQTVQSVRVLHFKQWTVQSDRLPCFALLMLDRTKGPRTF